MDIQNKELEEKTREKKAMEMSNEKLVAKKDLKINSNLLKR